MEIKAGKEDKLVVFLRAVLEQLPNATNVAAISSIVGAIAVLLYIYKIVSIFFSGLTSIFYLILYLCTLEILPTVVLVIGLMDWVK